MHSTKTVCQLALETCVELFASYGVDLRSSEEGELDGRTACAILDFSGALGRGKLLLAAAPEVLARTAGTVRASHDWVGELANQNLGRLKHRLLAHGIEILVPPPTLASRLSLSDGWDRSGYVFRCAEGWVWLRLEAGRFANLDLDGCLDPGIQQEGEIVLF